MNPNTKAWIFAIVFYVVFLGGIILAEWLLIHFLG